MLCVEISGENLKTMMRFRSGVRCHNEVNYLAAILEPGLRT